MRQILRMKVIIRLRGVNLDMTPNSHDYRTKKSVVLVRRINISILEMKGLRTLDPLHART